SMGNSISFSSGLDFVDFDVGNSDSIEGFSEEDSSCAASDERVWEEVGASISWLSAGGAEAPDPSGCDSGETSDALREQPEAQRSATLAISANIATKKRRMEFSL
ncbi:MAG: hypothetical protein Q4D38_15135, partial [Planctomycetia bacterium]|nr:hypothetical protein [Planctomycetia bacterium]